MLADSLDGNLGAAEQARFEGHIAECGPCSRLLAETQRGAAWLEELRMARPDPPADLLERILAVTSGAQRGWMQGHAAAWSRGEVVGFRRRLASAIQRGSFGQIVLQPRLAMTAAMAFFSIALTMNLTGVHPQDLRASDIQPASLRRAFYSANARVVQYYEGLRAGVAGARF